KPAQILASALGEDVRRALEPPKPAVDVALQDARGVRNESRFAERLQAGAAAALDQHGAAERLLAVRGGDRRARDAAAIGIADTPRVLAEQTGQCGLVPTRTIRDGVHQDLDAGGRPSRRDRHQAEPESPAQIAHVAAEYRSAAAATAAG